MLIKNIIMNISYSKIKDLKKSKHYFYKKHITNEIKFRVTDPMIVGSAIDCWLTEGEDKFRADYTVMSRRVKDETYRQQLTNSMYDKVIQAVECAESSQAYAELKDHQTQIKIVKPMKLGIFEGVSGILDFLKIEGDTAIITDLKTGANGSMPKYYYTCRDFNYFTQLAFYKFLVKYKYPEVKHFEYRHLVLELGEQASFVYPYKIDEELIDTEYNELLEYFEELKKLTMEDFKNPEQKGWEDAIVMK